MGVYAGPEITSDGLVLALDAGNSKGFDDDENYILNSTNLYNSCFETNGSGSDGDGTYVTYQDGGNKGYLGSIAPTGETSVRLKTPANYGGYSKQRTFFNINFPSSTECTVSIFYKNDPTNPIPSIQFWGQNTLGPNQGSVVTVSLTGSPGVSYGNGWYRLTVNLGTSPSTNNFNFFSLLLDSNYSNNRYCEFAGFQVEKGSSASPYYATTSTAKIRGTTLIDMTGRGNTGTLTNGPTYSSANGGSIVFDGTNDYVNLTKTSQFNFGTNDFTIQTFCNLTSKNTNYPCIFGNYLSYSAGAIYFGFDHDAAPTKYTIWVNGQGSPTLTSSTNVIYGSWTQLTLVRSSGVGYFYINNSLDGTPASMSASLNGDGSLLSIGRALDATNTHMRGYISNFKIYNRALSAAEIQQNYNATKSRFTSDGSLSYPFSSPVQAQNLGYTAGTYYFRSGSMSAPQLLEYQPNYYESRPFCCVFRSAYASTATTNKIDLSIPMGGLLVQRDTLDLRGAVYWSTPITYTTVLGTGNNTADSGTGYAGSNARRVILGGSGGHGLYNTGQGQCGWTTAAGAIGAGWNGSTCGTFPNGLIWGTGNGGGAVYDNQSGTWSHWITWN